MATGLDNPRGLAVGPGGVVLVAEAGRGGSGPCLPGPEGDTVCAGATGAVTAIWHGHQRRVATGLPSVAVAGGANATGPQDVLPHGPAALEVVIGLGQDPARRSELGPLGPAFAQVHVVSPFEPPKAIADLGAYEARDNPDAGQPGAAVDTNPTALARRGATRVAIDAGGNTLLRVGPGGAISTLAVFDTRLADAPPFLDLPPGTRIPMQSVPTSVAPGPDGSWYVGELTGFPFPVGAARVMRVSPGSPPVVVAEGFTNVMDVALDRAGGLWVLEIATRGLLSGDDTGALVRVAPDGTRTTVLTAGLHAPGGLALGRRGEIYVSNYGGSAARGEVLRVTPE